MICSYDGIEECVIWRVGLVVCGVRFVKLCVFFQAEDGIRDIGVTGVQTCALPICGVLLLNLAQAGLAVLHGESDSVLDTLGTFAVELAGSAWAGSSELVLVGFGGTGLGDRTSGVSGKRGGLGGGLVL